MTREEMLKFVIYGFPLGYGDVLYRLTKESQIEYVTIYNHEITGYSEGLKDIFKYGDNAYYWLASTPNGIPEIAKLGWSGEIIR